MGNRDFFSFCTTLKPVELKALGQLSHVRHLAEGTSLFHAGDTSDSIYIISRGVITVSPEDSPYPGSGSYLSRGDILGVAEVVTRSARTATAYACESCSVQCIPLENLDALIAKVPSFGLYLAEQLSWRVLQNDERWLGKSSCLDFSGNLRNFDIVAIVQTIYNSSKTGELVILNDEQEPVAGMFFRDGRPLCVKCHHLTGEEAFNQIFLHERMPGVFNFNPTEDVQDVREELAWNRGVDDMIINAVRQRDEFQMMLEQLPPFESRLRTLRPLEEWIGSPELYPIAQEICEVVNRQQTRIEELFWLTSYCELNLYKALVELVENGMIHLVGSVDSDHRSTVAA